MASRVTTRRAAPRRKLVWARTGPNTIFVPDVAFVDLLDNFQTNYGAQLIGCTVMRIRGRYQWQMPNALTATQTLPVTAGIRVYDDSEFSDLSVAQGPINDQHADWMYYDSVFATDWVSDGTNFNLLGTEDFDVRSRRKVEELGQGLLLAFQSGIIGEPGVKLTYQASVLLALP